MNASQIRARAMGASRTAGAAQFTFTSLDGPDTPPGQSVQVLILRASPDNMRLAREAATTAKGDPAKGIADTISNERMLVALGIQVTADQDGAQIFEMKDLDSLMTNPCGADLMAVGMRVSKVIQAAGN